MYLLLVAVLIILVTSLLVASYNRPKNYPPGPLRIPVIGQVFSLDRKQPHKTLDRWAAKYGPAFSVKLGVQDLVVLSSPDIIREAFSLPETSVRPGSSVLTMPARGNYGLVLSNGSLWKENRSLISRYLRDLGSGKSNFENIVREEVEEVIKREFLPKLGHSIDLTHSFYVAILSIMWVVGVGKRIAYEDKRVKQILDAVGGYLQTLTRAAPLEFFPWLQYLGPDRVFRLKQLATFMGDFNKIAKFLVDEHKATYDNSQMRDYIDCYIKKMKEEEGNPHSNFFEWQLLANLFDLFGAGGETTATTLRWALLFLCRYPDHQKKLQEEIDDVIGRHRPPKFKDKNMMPYMEAFIAEVQRAGNIAPAAIPHSTDQDTIIAGYTIPKGTRLLALQYRVHTDPALWSNPRQFDPTRFLDANGKFVKNDNLIPFSVGRRQCPGEILARMELFLFITSFLQRFRFSFPEGQEVGEEPNETTGKAVLEPQPYQLIVQTREDRQKKTM